MTMDEKPTIPLWLQHALNELGESEKGETAENPTILKYFKEVGHPTITNDETPWCAAYVGAMLERSNYKSTKSLLARSYLNWGAEIDKAQLGAIAIFKRGGSKTLGHVGFVMAETESQIQLLSGNQNNKVSIATYYKSQLLGIRWPNEKNDRYEGEEKKTQSRFEIALEHVLNMEGGWSNHKDDKGGPTFKGITLNTYKQAVREGIIEQGGGDDIKALKKLSSTQIKKIYQELYWQKAGCQYFPLSVSIALFDAAVNHGPARAVKILQSAIGAEIDGEVGPETIMKSNPAPLAVTLEKFIEKRAQFYHQLKQFKIFGKGWMNRLKNTDQVAKQYLSTNEHPPKKFKTPKRKVSPKMQTDPYDETKKWWGESLTVWGTIVTALATILPIIGPFIGIDISGEMIRQFGETVAKLIQIIGGLTGTTMALYGRSRATTKLTRKTMEMKL